MNYTELYRECLELSILENMEVIAARTAAKATPEGPLIGKEELKTWSQLMKTMGQLGYGMEDKCPWAFLGVPKLEGPEPTPDFIAGRARMAMDLLSETCMPGWEIGAAEQAVETKGKLEQCVQHCINGLKEVRQERRRLAKTSNPLRWAEPSPDFALFLAERCQWGQTAKMALYISNLQSFDLTRLEGAMLPMSDTRALYGNLNGSQAQLKSALVALKGHTLYVWAPDNNRMAMIMTSLSKLMQEEVGSWKIHFVVMYQPMPGCEKADDILELWTHPLLHNNYTHGEKRGILPTPHAVCDYRTGLPNVPSEILSDIHGGVRRS